MRKLTFVGGHHDGAKMFVRDEDIVFRLIIPPVESPILEIGDELVDHEPDMEMEIYKRTTISGDKRRFDCFIHCDMSPDSMIYSLLEHYHPCIGKDNNK